MARRPNLLSLLHWSHGPGASTYSPSHIEFPCPRAQTHSFSHTVLLSSGRPNLLSSSHWSHGPGASNYYPSHTESRGQAPLPAFPLTLSSPGHVPKPILVLILCSSRLDASTYSPFHTESPSQAPQRTLPLKLSHYGQAPQPTLPLTLSSPGQAPQPTLPLTLSPRAMNLYLLTLSH